MLRHEIFSVETASVAPAKRRCNGLALLELLVAIGIIAVLLAIALVAISRTREAAHAAQCLNHLRVIGGGFQSYCVDNSSRFPDPLAVQSTWESMVRKYLPTIAVLHCPVDREVFPSLGSSYDWRDGGNTSASVAGRSIHSCRSDAVLAFEALPGWHRRRTMNVVRIDGAVLSMHEQECLSDLKRSVTGEHSGR